VFAGFVSPPIPSTTLTLYPHTLPRVEMRETPQTPQIFCKSLKAMMLVIIP
jgi:hypothetical protein